VLIEQESGAGHFYYALLAKNKAIYFISKLGILLVLALGSLSFAVIGFGIGFHFLLHQNTFSISFYIISIIIIFVSQVFLYVLHLFLSLRFSTGVSIGLGIVESLLTALLQTGLGDGIWKWIPCSWSARLSKNYMLYLSDIQFKKLYSSEFRTGLVFCILMTIIIFAYVIIWFQHFEGRKEE
jgi:ABC-2 type transport system permease protein